MATRAWNRAQPQLIMSWRPRGSSTVSRLSGSERISRQSFVTTKCHGCVLCTDGARAARDAARSEYVGDVGLGVRMSESAARPKPVMRVTGDHADTSGALLRVNGVDGAR